VGSPSPRSAVLAALLSIAVTPASAWAQNTSFGTSVHMLVGQTPIRVNLDTDHFYDAPVVINRSYCAEAGGADDETNPTHPALTIYRNDQTTSLGIETGNLEPKGAAASRVCFIAPASEIVFIKVSPFDANALNHNHTMRFVETTLWANWFFVGGDYSSYTLIRNTTSAAIMVDIRWFAANGAEQANRLAQNVPANGILAIDARSAMSCPFPSACPAANGSVQVSHAGSPEAIVGSQTTLSGGTGLSFDTLFFQRHAW
jgi:hypothetical protein